jgi:hypothetical protein
MWLRIVDFTQNRKERKGEGGCKKQQHHLSASHSSADSINNITMGLVGLVAEILVFYGLVAGSKFVFKNHSPASGGVKYSTALNVKQS